MQKTRLKQSLAWLLGEIARWPGWTPRIPAAAADKNFTLPEISTEPANRFGTRIPRAKK
jgi:hypothetical protein